MTWSAADAYREGLGFFTGIVASVPDDRWGAPSPCEGWSALDVLGHVGEATGMGVRILLGEAMEFTRHDPPGSIVEGEPAAWWEGLAEQAREALAGVDDLDREVDSPMGRRTVRAGLSFPAVDLFIHGWDLARATGQQVAIPGEAAEFMRALFDAIPEEHSRRPGIFAAQRTAGPEASTTDELIAFTGRDPDWAMPR